MELEEELGLVATFLMYATEIVLIERYIRGLKFGGEMGLVSGGSSSTVLLPGIWKSLCGREL